MPLNKTPLYNCMSEKFLAKLLKITYPLKYKTIKQQLADEPLLFYKYWRKSINGKDRDIFECKPMILNIHKRIRYFINKINFPPYLYSGLKGKSYLQNAFFHEDSNFYFLIDIKDFFPTISQQKIKSILVSHFKQSNDVADFISLAITTPQKNGTIRSLVTGSPLSQIFSFFINKKMFDEIQSLAMAKNIKFSLYVDDLSFSSKSTIPYSFVKDIFRIVKSNGYEVHPRKVQYGQRGKNSEITGVRFEKDNVLITKKREGKITSLIEKINDKKANLENFDKELKSFNSCIEQACLVNPIYAKFKFIP